MRLEIVKCVASLSMPLATFGFTNKFLQKNSVFKGRITTKEAQTNTQIAIQGFNIKNPFANDEKDFELKSPFPSSDESSPVAESLFSKARTIIGSDFGVRDDSLFDDEFSWIGPDFQSSILDKEQYLAAGKFFDLRYHMKEMRAL